jgi:hypothetical protein
MIIVQANLSYAMTTSKSVTQAFEQFLVQCTCSCWRGSEEHCMRDI